MSLEHNQNIQEYLATVCSQIKWKEVHKPIREELLTHLSDIVVEYVQNGLSEADAIDKAISQMGDPVNVGLELHKAHKPRIEWSLVGIVGSLLGLGLLSIYSIQVSGLVRYNDSLFIKTLIFLIIGLLSIVGLYSFDYRKIRSVSRMIYLCTLLVLVFGNFFGLRANGIPILNLGFFHISFLGVTPFLFAIALSGIFLQWNWQRLEELGQAILILTAPVILYLMIPSMSSIVIYMIAVLTLLLVSGAKRTHILLAAASPLVLVVGAILQNPYRLQRLITYFNPSGDPLGSGYQQVTSLELIRSAGLWGQGFTFPSRMLGEIHTDMIFTYLVFTFGWLAGLAIMAAALTLIIRMIRLARQVKDSYGRLLVSSITAIFLVQFFWNILMTMGLMPIMGIGLPFISYGGTQLLMQMAAVGLMLSIYRRKDIERAPIK